MGRKRIWVLSMKQIERMACRVTTEYQLDTAQESTEFTHLYTRSFSNTFMLHKHNMLGRRLESKWFFYIVAVILGRSAR